MMPSMMLLLRGLVEIIATTGTRMYVSLALISYSIVQNYANSGAKKLFVRLIIRLQCSTKRRITALVCLVEIETHKYLYLPSLVMSVFTTTSIS